MVQTAYVGNDNLLIVDAVVNADGDYLNDATVSVTLTDKRGNEVSGGSWPLSVPYVAGSNGKYQVTLEDGLALVSDKVYIANITIDAGDDLIALYKMRICATNRN